MFDSARSEGDDREGSEAGQELTIGDSPSIIDQEEHCSSRAQTVGHFDRPIHCLEEHCQDAHLYVH